MLFDKACYVLSRDVKELLIDRVATNGRLCISGFKQMAVSLLVSLPLQKDKQPLVALNIWHRPALSLLAQLFRALCD